MSENKSPDLKQEESTGNAFYDWLLRVYERFNVFSAFKEDDNILMLGVKVIVRIIGFLFLLLISPFVLVGLMLAFFAAL